MASRIEAKLKMWSKSLEASQAKAEGAEAAAKVGVEKAWGELKSALDSAIT